jgi:hypothetical protein
VILAMRDNAKESVLTARAKVNFLNAKVKPHALSK